MLLTPNTLALSPEGRLHPRHDASLTTLPELVSARVLSAFGLGQGAGLLHLGAAEVATALPQPWAFWRDLGVRYCTVLRKLPHESGEVLPEAALSLAEQATLALTVPPMPGAEYATSEVLAELWLSLQQAAAQNVTPDVQTWLTAQNPAWQAVGRVHLNLAELKGDAERPFAFVATYTTRLSAAARPQHAPLGKAVREAAQSVDQATLLALLAPVQRACEACAWLKQKFTAGDLYAPVRWPIADAVALLQHTPTLEQAGVLVRLPEQWRGRPPARAQVTVTIGGEAQVKLDSASLLDFSAAVTIDGQPVTAAELQAILASTDGLQMLRGQWVQVDGAKIAAALHHYQEAAEMAGKAGLSFHDALRLLAGAGSRVDQGLASEVRDWTKVSAGPWLAQTLANLRDPKENLAAIELHGELHATLRPYQQSGVAWLHLLVSLGLGACLADDMGLGKTLQVLALVLALRRQPKRGPVLVVVPASLIGNWQAEAAKFAPSLQVRVAHASAKGESLWEPAQSGIDLVLATYGGVARDARLAQTNWRLLVLDEAQAVKNPGTRQAKAVRTLQSSGRVAMTGTPVENRPGDLWALMDFLNPGLLGSAQAFGKLLKALGDRPDGYAPLRKLVQPYVLRRKKTDKSVVADLPDKTEMVAYCGLAKAQIAHYQRAVEALTEALDSQVAGMARRGLILAFLMRFKQICNHPSQWLGDGAWLPADGGKFARLREIAEVVAERQEKMLVFTQFRETTAPLQAFLQGIFGSAGLVLHGEIPVGKRKALVDQFQTDPDVGFFVLSLKAGGTGLNLTAASHVVHFDRWWNPAVEDQATDRAFRIGQKRNVVVHKFVCRGTVEERIDQMIAGKRALADDLLQGGGEVLLTELDDKALLELVKLDLRALHGDGD